MNEKCLVVLSGGQDSTICLFWAKEKYKEVHAITFDYGQKHNSEIRAAIKVAQMAGVAPQDHSILEFDSVYDYTGGVHSCGNYRPLLVSSSPLVDRNNQLETYKSYEEMQQIIGTRVEKTFVPMRNTLFLTLAANRAVAKGINHLITGVCEADGANYPDCTGLFINSIKLAFRVGLNDPNFMVIAPLLHLSKSRSILTALDLPGCYRALAYSHTAYDGRYPPTGKDHASVLRAHGFEEANVPDPLVLRAYWEKAIPELPGTKNYDRYRNTAVAVSMEQALFNLEQELRGKV